MKKLKKRTLQKLSHDLFIENELTPLQLSLASGGMNVTIKTQHDTYVCVNGDIFYDSTISEDNETECF